MTDRLQESIPMLHRRSFAPRRGHPTLGHDEIVALKANACVVETEKPKAFPVFAVLIWLMLPIMSRSETLPEPGPESRGLRLRLMISSSTASTGQGMMLELLNVGHEPLTWSIASCPGDPKEKRWLFPFAYFRTKPPVRDGGVQVGMRNDCVTLDKRLDAGASLRESYVTSDKGIYTDHNSITFPSRGIYQVVAELYMPPGPKQVRVVSNPASFIVGDSTGLPKQTSARITKTNKDHTKVQLYLGPHHGIQPGDVYRVGWKGGGSAWNFIVTELTGEMAWADAKETVDPNPDPIFRRVPFPGVGTTLELSPTR